VGANGCVGAVAQRRDLTALDTDATGAQVSFTEPENDDLIARAWVESTTGYAAGAADTIHVGLGDQAAPSLRVLIEPLGGKPINITAAVGGRTSVAGC